MCVDLINNVSIVTLLVVSVCTLIKKFKFSSYIRKFRVSKPHIWLNFCEFAHILGSPSSYIILKLLHSEFPYIWGKFDFLFCKCIESVGLSVAARHWSRVWKQLLISNERNTLRWYFFVSFRIGSDSFENLSLNEQLKARSVERSTTINPPLFSLVNTFK